MSQMTASYWARFMSVNAPASSVASTVKPLAAPICSMAAMPAGIESWRNPAVFENTSTLSRGGCATALAEVRRTARAATSARSTKRVPRMCGLQRPPDLDSVNLFLP
jgi:hypothetical protein